MFNIILQFHYYLPLEKNVAFHLKKLETLSPKDALCQVWLKFAQWSLRKRFLNVVNVFFTISLLSPFGERRGPSLNKHESPSAKDALCQVWLKLAKCF